MFEKDEDYRKARKASKDRITKVIKVWSAREETLHDEGFQKGAEFGYNKANEWHYVKDGLPQYNEYVLIYTDLKNTYVARIPTEKDYFITRRGGFVQMSAVIAWKEIVLPKESE